MKEVKVEIILNEQALYTQIMSVVNESDTMTEIHQRFAEIIDPWVPYDTGQLSTNLTIDETGVTYNAYDEEDGYYAAKNYYGIDIRHKTEHHPLATAYWDRVAMQTERDRLTNEVLEIIIRRINNG